MFGPALNVTKSAYLFLSHAGLQTVKVVITLSSRNTELLNTSQRTTMVTMVAAQCGICEQLFHQSCVNV